MTDRLYKFLKDKGEEFCYVDRHEPFLVNPYVPVEYIQEYADLIIKEIDKNN